MGKIGFNMKVAGIGYVGNEYHRKTLHEVKAIAGRAFHAENVISVCVYDEAGVARLYLRKDPDGTYHREERK